MNKEVNDCRSQSFIMEYAVPFTEFQEGAALLLGLQGCRPIHHRSVNRFFQADSTSCGDFLYSLLQSAH